MRLTAVGSPLATLVAAVIACQAATGVRAATGVTPAATGPSDCSTAVADAAVLNPLALFDGWSSCAAEDRSEDANFLLILSQIRAMADVLTLVPLDEGLNDWAGGIEQAIQLLRYQFGSSELYASYENVAPLDVRLQNAELLLPANYDPGWSYRMPVDATAYGRTVQQQREVRLRAMSFFAMRASAGRVDEPTIPIAIEDLVLPGMLAAQVAVGTPLSCSSSLASVAELNAWSLFIGANACSAERRVADALFLLLVGQSRADADMLVLRPLADFEPGLFELSFESAYQLGGMGFDPFFYVLPFYSFFGDQPFLAFLRDAAAVEALLQRVENAPTALAAGYDPGWEYQPPADGAMYERAIASDRQNRAVVIRSLAYLMANDAYYRAQLEIQDYLAAHVGEVIDGGDLMDIWAGMDAVLMGAFADPEFPQVQRQVATGFNGPAVRSTMVLFSEADVRQSWLAEALPEDELLALISRTDFDREALVTLALGRRSNASGEIILSDVYYSTGVGVPQNDGYGISVMLGVVPRECGVPFTDSFPFVVARIAAMPGVAGRVGTAESNFDGGCGPIVSAEPVTALVGDEFPTVTPPTAEEIARILAAVDDAAARRGPSGPAPTGGPLPTLTADELAARTAAQTRPPENQVAMGFNGPAEEGTLILRTADEVRQSWLPEALGADELAAVLVHDFTKEALVVFALGSQTNVSGKLILFELFYDGGFPVGTNAGYWVSARLGVVPETCAQPTGAESFPFIVGRVVNAREAVVINQSFAVFADECGEVVAGAPIE